MRLTPKQRIDIDKAIVVGWFAPHLRNNPRLVYFDDKGNPHVTREAREWWLDVQQQGKRIDLHTGEIITINEAHRRITEVWFNPEVFA